MSSFRKLSYFIAFLSPLLGENSLISIGGLKIPAIFSFVLLAVAFALSKKPDYLLLFRSRVFLAALMYIGIVFFNYGYVLKDFFFKVFAELTPLWISLIRRLILSLAIFFAFKDEKQAVRLFYFYCAGLVLSSLSAYLEVSILKHSVYDAAIVTSNEGYYRAIGFFSNPNDFALTVVVASIFVLQHYLFSKKKSFLILYLLLIPPLLWSYSRNGLACFILSIILIVYLGKSINLKRILILGGVGVLLIALVTSIPSVRERVFLLFSGEDSSFAARTIVLIGAYQKWLTMPFLGIGIYSTPLLFIDSGNEGLLLTIHNFYAHTLLEAGILGFVIVLFFLISVYKLAKKIYKVHKETNNPLSAFSRGSLIAIIVTYFYIVSGNHINFEFFWYLIGVNLVIWRRMSRDFYGKEVVNKTQLAFG